MATQAQTVNHFAGQVAHGVGDVLPRPVGNNLTQLTTDYELEMDTNGAICCAMLNSLEGIGNVTVQAANPVNPSIALPAPAAGAAPVLQHDVALIPNPDQRAFLEQYNSAITAARAWVRDLTACHQVAALTADNIENYFRALNGTRVRGAAVLRILNVTKNLFPKLVDIDVVRAAFTNIEFIRYHVAYASTPGLVRRFIEDTVGFTHIDPATIAAVDNAILNYWDRAASDAIPKRVVAMTRAYLEAVGALPANWYQGRKARDATSPTLYNKWVVAFTRWQAIETGVTDVMAATDVATLITAIGAAALTA